MNVPSKLDRICSVLPRLPSEAELVHFNLKRKIAYRGHYIYGHVGPQKLKHALVWLKHNNPLYKNVIINDDWLEEALCNDPDLLSALIENCVMSDEQDKPMECELSSNDPKSDSVQSEPTSSDPQNKPNATSNHCPSTSSDTHSVSVICNAGEPMNFEPSQPVQPQPNTQLDEDLSCIEIQLHLSESWHV